MGKIKQFTVEAKVTITATATIDYRKNQVRVLFDPYLCKLPHEQQHRVSEEVIYQEASRVALQLAAELSGMAISKLKIRHEGVGAIIVVPKEGTFPTTKDS